MKIIAKFSTFVLDITNLAWPNKCFTLYPISNNCVFVYDNDKQWFVRDSYGIYQYIYTHRMYNHTRPMSINY